MATGENVEFADELIVSFVCLFLILSVGISHGAMDSYKADNILKMYKTNNKIIEAPKKIWLILCVNNESVAKALAIIRLNIEIAIMI